MRPCLGLLQNPSATVLHEDRATDGCGDLHGVRATLVVHQDGGVLVSHVLQPVGRMFEEIPHGGLQLHVGKGDRHLPGSQGSEIDGVGDGDSDGRGRAHVCVARRVRRFNSNLGD